MNNVLTFGETNNILNAPIILACMRKYERLIDDIIIKHGYNHIMGKIYRRPHDHFNIIELSFRIPNANPENNKIQLRFVYNNLPRRIREDKLDMLFNHFYLSFIGFDPCVHGETFNMIRKYLEQSKLNKNVHLYFHIVYDVFNKSIKHNNTILEDLKIPIRLNKNRSGMEYAKIPKNFFNSPSLGYTIDDFSSDVLKPTYDQYESNMSHIMFTIRWLRVRVGSDLSRVIMEYLYV